MARSTARDAITSQSNYGTAIDVSAPSYGVDSTNSTGGYSSYAGTSLAAPLVSGVAALLFSQGFNLAQVDSYLMQADSMNCWRGAGACGAGRLNAFRALQSIESSKWPTNWSYQAGIMRSSPDAASWKQDCHLDVFHKGTDNQLWHKWYFCPSGWYAGWDPLGAPVGGFNSDPGAVSWGVGRVDVFARDITNNLRHAWFDGGQWNNAWTENLGKPCDPMNPLVCDMASGPDAASMTFGRLDVFARGPSNNLYQLTFNNGWGSWVSRGGPPGGFTGDPGAVSWGNGRIDVFVRGSDGALWHIWYQGTWSAWESLGEGLAAGSGPDVASWGATRLDVFYRGTDDQQWRKWFDGTFWSHSENLGGILRSDPASVSWGSGKIDTFHRGTDDAQWHKWRT